MFGFVSEFRSRFKPLLETGRSSRAESFEAVFRYLESLGRGEYLIVETGCVRQDAWTDGRSTVLFHVRGLAIKQTDPRSVVTEFTRDPISGAVDERFAYEAYGKPIELSAGFVAQADARQWETRFTGQRWESATSLLLARRRHLHVLCGRWLSRDDAIYADGYNLYQYVGNNPATQIDPMGNLKVEATKPKLDDDKRRPWTSPECGRPAQMFWKFTLDTETPCDGYFVQHIREYHRSRNVAHVRPARRRFPREKRTKCTKPGFI